MKNIILGLFAILLIVNCSNKEDDPETDDCGGNLTLTVDGTDISYGTPTQAFLVFNAFSNAHELGIIWNANGSNVNLQLLLDLGSENCVPIKRNELTNLSSEVSLFSIQYASLEKQSSVSSVFFEDGDTGYIEITRCDGIEDMIDIEFGFTGTTVGGDPISVSSGLVQNVCFTRTK